MLSGMSRSTPPPTPNTGASGSAVPAATDRHVVVGVDGSTAALQAVEWAAHEASRRGLDLRLIACYSVPFYGEPGMLGTYAIETQVDAIKAEYEGYVHAAVGRATAAQPGLAIDSVVMLGSPSSVLAHSVVGRGELVVGSTGRTGRLGDVIGSVATAVAHHTPAAVVVVPATSSRKGDSMKRIVVGTDGSESANEALEWAYAEAKLAKAELVVVHGWEYPYPDVSAAEHNVHERMGRDAQHHLDDAIAAIRTRAKSDGVSITAQLVESGPAKALVEASADADLVVVGSRGRSGFASLLLGSVSRAVVQHASCPVAVIRPHAR